MCTTPFCVQSSIHILDTPLLYSLTNDYSCDKRLDPTIIQLKNMLYYN